MLESRGYTLGPEVMELALFRVDGAARKELMIVYLEDLERQGFRAAELLGVSRYTVYRMINRYGVTASRGRGFVAAASAEQSRL